MQDSILKALHWRYGTKIFNPEKKISFEELRTILESGRLAPSALGIEPWKFIVIESPEVREKLKVAGYGQPKITDAPYLIVIAYRTDAENLTKERIERTAKIQNQDPSELQDLKNMLESSIARTKSSEQLHAWLKCQSYIPLGIMIETAALLGIDAGPMEGFDAQKVDKILGLQEKNLSVATMVALGHRGDDPVASRPKVRRSFDEVVEFVKEY